METARQKGSVPVNKNEETKKRAKPMKCHCGPRSNNRGKKFHPHETQRKSAGKVQYWAPGIKQLNQKTTTFKTLGKPKRNQTKSRKRKRKGRCILVVFCNCLLGSSGSHASGFRRTCRTCRTSLLSSYSTSLVFLITRIIRNSIWWRRNWHRYVT
jgi:hypothetical protein